MGWERRGHRETGFHRLSVHVNDRVGSTSTWKPAKRYSRGRGGPSRSRVCPAIATYSYHSLSYSYIACTFVSNLVFVQVGISPLTFPGSLKEEPHNEDLQPSHANHQPALHHTEIKYPALCALDGTEIAILTGPEVFLVAMDSRKVSRDFHNGLF